MILEKPSINYQKCTTCGAYIGQEFMFEPCECVSIQYSDAKIVDSAGNETKISLKARHVLPTIE